MPDRQVADPARKMGDSTSWPVQVSNLFAPVQTLGLVTDGVPVAVYRLGTEGFIAASVGNSFHVMDTKKLQIVLRSPILPHPITAIAAARSDGGRVFVALKNINAIAVFDRLVETTRLIGHLHQILGLSVLGSLLISWSQWAVFVWDLQTFALIGRIPAEKESGGISCVIHPETYLNKIVIGYHCGGELQLWNIKTFKHIHSFRSSSLSGGVSALSLSIHPNVIGVGYSNGLLRLIDLQKDQVLCQLQHSSEQGSVKSLTYRKDAECLTPGAFVSGCENGDLVVWDTKDSSMLHLVESAHSVDCGGLSHVECLGWEPLMISAGMDNSICVWIFDGIDQQPRILLQRQGLPASIERLEVYDDQGKDLLTIGTFNRKCFFTRTSAIQQHQNVYFSQKKSLRLISQKWRHGISQLPPCVDVAHAFCRHYDWANIATCHERMRQVWCRTFEWYLMVFFSRVSQ